MSDAAVVSPSDDCTNFEIVRVQQQLLSVPQAGRAVIFDLTRAGKVDTSCLQPVTAARRRGRCAFQDLPQKTVDDGRRIGRQFPGKDAA
jgi:hypothetical protein